MGDEEGHHGRPWKTAVPFGWQILEVQIGDAVGQIRELIAANRR